MPPTTTRQRTPSRVASRVDARRLARERMLRRRRRTFLGAVLLIALAVVGVDMLQGGTKDPRDTAVAATRSPQPRATTAAAAVPSQSAGSPSPSAETVTYPKDGSRSFTTARGGGGVAGSSGTLLRYQVDVEKDIHGIDVQKFADAVTAILGAPQGWTAGGEWRFQRVGPGEAHDFTLNLVTPGTRDSMCGDTPDGYTSCRNGDNVMINVSRWVHGVPFYPSLAQYRDYAISHEVGHRLGHGHELCPGKGRKAPTMQQQTLGLHGCVANPWPYPGGKRYAGPQGDYSQAHIPSDPPSYFTR